MKRLSVLLPLLLAGCGAVASREARDPYGALIGMAAPDLLACAGQPDRVQQTGPGTLIAQWDYHAEPAKVLSVSVTLVGTVDVGGGARSCKMVATVLRDGTVADVAFPGRDASLTALPYAGCDVLVRECVDHPSSTGVPAGYDAFHYLLPAKKD